MKARTRSTIWIILCVLLGIALFPGAGSATPRNTSLLQTTSDPQTLSFARLGSRENSLRGPYDAAYLDFSLPATWELQADAALRLNYNLFFARSDKRTSGAFLQVVLNGVTLETVLLNTAGEQSVNIPITQEALAAVRSDGRHSLALLLDTNERCDTEDQTMVIIRPGSVLSLPHRLVAPPTDLARLPYPIVQRSIDPDAAILVVPDQPAAAELQAAMTIAAGLGRLTGGTLDLRLVPTSALSDTLRADNHLIMIGKPPGLPLLNELTLPLPVHGNSFNLPTEQTTDGIVQLVPSPWSEDKVVLVVSGNDDAAVVKAAQAVSTGSLRTSTRSDLSLVADVQAPPTNNTLNLDQSLADLGYQSQTMYGAGGQYAGYLFEIPPGMLVGEEAYIDLVFVHSALLDYDQSAVTVSVNDEPIASLRLDDNSTHLGGARVTLPPAALRAGSNQLTLRADLLPRAVCTDPRGNGLWFTIRHESSIHLPLLPSDSAKAPPKADLSRYPLPFTALPNLGGLTMMLGTNDPHGWDVATGIALGLGARMQGVLADPVVQYASSGQASLPTSRNLLVIGRVDRLPILQEFGPQLPAPFAPGSLLASEPDSSVTYRLASDTSLGYLQLFAAPWNANQAVLAVLGSTDQGLTWAGAALNNPRLRSSLKGNLAVIRDERVETKDTRPTLAEVTPTPEPAAANSSPAATPSTTILLGLAGAGLGLLTAIVIGLVWLRRRWLRSRTRAMAEQGATPPVATSDNV